ncbi:GntR family transcriptional regulator [Actinomadura sp. 1N219]|uniref:GntR family transcriptional regulator n=1 Tax=Actinomadura sp. 1N219 TaxID=3375152 RepID=UPI0037A3DFF3
METSEDAGAEAQLPLRDVVARRIRELILTGGLSPGERLPEDHLAEQLGVSRNPVREALRTLEAEGFVQVAARRGASVATLSIKQADDLFDLRLALEPLGARLAARHVTQPAVDLLRKILAMAQQDGARRSAQELSDLHTELHSKIFEMSRNDHLISVALPIVRRGQWLLLQHSSLKNPHAWDEHEPLIAAIEMGAEELAETTARAHVLSVRHRLLPRIG